MSDVAAIDANDTHSIQGVSSIDFDSSTNIAVNPSTKAMLVEGTLALSGTSDVNLKEVGGSAFALGQQLSTASIPVVLTSAQISTLTPLASVAVTQSTSPWVTSVGNASGASAVNIQDGGNSITIDGSISFSNTTIAVTNAGTFATQSAITAASGSISSGAISSGAIASGAIASGAVASGAFASGSISDGADVTLGAKADAKSTATDATPITAMQVLKQISASVQSPPSQAVTGTFYQSTQPVSIASAQVASGAFASGSIASGAIASGAIASGAVASGAFASGSIAAGAVAAGASSFVKLEDAASADGDAGVPGMAIQKASPADTAGTDGDYAMLQMSGGRLWVDASGKTLTVGSHAVTNAGTFAVQSTETSPTTVFNGKTTVTTAGTRVALAGSTTVKSVTIKALAANTGTMYVGNATVASTNGFALAAGDTISMDIADLATVNIDSSVNGESVTYLAVN